MVRADEPHELPDIPVIKQEEKKKRRYKEAPKNGRKALSFAQCRKHPGLPSLCFTNSSITMLLKVAEYLLECEIRTAWKGKRKNKLKS